MSLSIVVSSHLAATSEPNLHRCPGDLKIVRNLLDILVARALAQIVGFSGNQIAGHQQLRRQAFSLDLHLLRFPRMIEHIVSNSAQ